MKTFGNMLIHPSIMVGLFTFRYRKINKFSVVMQKMLSPVKRGVVGEELFRFLCYLEPEGTYIYIIYLYTWPPCLGALPITISLLAQIKTCRYPSRRRKLDGLFSYKLVGFFFLGFFNLGWIHPKRALCSFSYP